MADWDEREVLRSRRERVTQVAGHGNHMVPNATRLDLARLRTRENRVCKHAIADA